ncbi:MAG: Uma2 family endonuclease [Prochloron sp. SP5CPC1]|nr:Uma2 family endonuclease [Candidatus Paraprochloron terpiosi SP5CPC1]
MTMVRKKRFTLQEYHRLTEIGFFKEDDRVELIQGEIMEMAAKGTAHTVCCSNLLIALAMQVSDRAKLRCQDPILLPSNSEPEPDFAVVRNREDDYLASHPTPEDILLVIEIADSSLHYDRQIKLPLYAAAGITDYWIVNLLENQLESYQKPFQKQQGDYDYSKRQIFLPHNTITLPGFGSLALDLNLVFPR